MIAFGLGKVARQVMRQNTMPQLGLRTRYDLTGLRRFLDVGNAGRKRIVEELHRADLQHAHIRTKPYTPKTNGKAERFIKTLQEEWAYGRAYQTSKQRNQWLPK